MLGDEFLVRTLEDGEYRARRTVLDDLDEVFDPEEPLVAHHGRYEPPLVVRTVVADLLRAGAQRLHRHLHHHPELAPLSHGAHERTPVLHQSHGAGDRSPFLDEIGELDFHVGAFGLQGRADLVEDMLEILDVNVVLVLVEHLDEPAHVGSLEHPGQINIQIDGCHGILRAFQLVRDHDGIRDPFHADLLDIQRVFRLFLLDVLHGVASPRKDTQQLSFSHTTTSRSTRGSLMEGASDMKMCLAIFSAEGLILLNASRSLRY